MHKMLIHCYCFIGIYLLQTEMYRKVIYYSLFYSLVEGIT